MAVLSPRFLAALAAAPNPWAEQIVHQVRSVGGRIPHDTGDYSIPHPDPASAPIGKLEYLYYPENPVRQRPGRIMVKTIDTHPDYRRQGVARSLMQQMHDDHPNIAIDPGYTTGYGEALKQQLLKENPEKSHLALPGDPSSAPPRTGLRTARGTPLFVYRQAIELTDEEAKVFMDFVNQQKGPIKTKIGPPQKVKPIPAEAFEHLFKRQNPSGTWYHASPHDLPMGTKLVPGGAPAASKDFYEQGFGEDTGTLIDMGGGRNKHVWMTPDLDDAHFWSAVNQAPHIYEVDPERDPAPWNGSGTDGWVAPSATIRRKVAAAADWTDKIRYMRPNAMSRQKGGYYVIDHPNGQDRIGLMNFSVYPHEYDQPRVYINAMDTHPDFQRQGVGTALMQRLVNDHPGHQIDFGETSAAGTALRDRVLKDVPGLSDVFMQTGPAASRQAALPWMGPSVPQSNHPLSFHPFEDGDELSMAVSANNGYDPMYHYPGVAAFKGDDMVGHIEWYGPHSRGAQPLNEVAMIKVHPEHKRQGIGTALFDWAKENVNPDLHHSPLQTDEGRGWAGKTSHRELTPEEMELHEQEGWRGEPCCDPSHGEGHLSGRCSVCGKRTSYAYEDKVPRQRAASTTESHRDRWNPGERAHFEYHCNQSPDSPDYYLWQHTQQPVEVLGLGDCDDFSDEMPTIAERSEEGVPLTYRVRFDDGVEGPAFEDELLTHPKYFDPRHSFKEENRHDIPGQTPPRQAALPLYQAPTQPTRLHRGVGIILTPELREKIKAGLDWGDDFNPQFKHFSIGPAILDHMEQTQQGGMQDNPGLGHYWSENPKIAEGAANESLTYNNLGWDEHGHRQIPAVVSGIWDGKGIHQKRISEDPHLGEHVLGPDARIAIDSVRIPTQEGYGKGPWMEVYNDPDSPDWGHLGNQRPSIRHASLPDPWADQIQHRPRGEPGRGPGGTYFIPHPSISGDEAGSLTYTRYPPEEEYAKPFLGIDWLTTHPEVQRQGVATSLLRRMVKDHPGYQVNPGYTSESGTKLRKHLWENEPSAQDIMTHAMRVLEAAGTFKLKEMLPGDLDWLEEGGNPAAYLPQEPSGKWYHTSPYEMKPGDRIVPGGAPSPGGEGEWSFYEKGKSNRPNHVWLSRNPDEAKWWRNWAGHGANIYEVKPGDRPQPWNLSGGQGWVAPHATVVRKLDVGPHSYLDSLIPPEERRVAQSHAPYHIDESPWYNAVYDEMLDEEDEDDDWPKPRPEVMVRKRLSQTGVVPDMNTRKQLNKFKDRIYRARQNGDHAVADYYEHLRDMMLADVEVGVPKPFSYYEPQLQEEFDL